MALIPAPYHGRPGIQAPNWIHNGDAYTANQLVFPERPFRIEGYLKLKF